MPAKEPITAGILELRPLLGKRYVGCSQTRWSDDLRGVKGSNWMGRAEGRTQWRTMEDT